MKQIRLRGLQMYFTFFLPFSVKKRWQFLHLIRAPVSKFPWQAILSRCLHQIYIFFYVLASNNIFAYMSAHSTYL